MLEDSVAKWKEHQAKSLTNIAQGYLPCCDVVQRSMIPVSVYSCDPLRNKNYPLFSTAILRSLPRVIHVSNVLCASVVYESGGMRALDHRAGQPERLVQLQLQRWLPPRILYDTVKGFFLHGWFAEMRGLLVRDIGQMV